MDDFIKIECDIDTNNPTAELGLEIWIDSNKIFDSTVVGPRHFEYRINDDDGEHKLEFVLKNKTSNDTIINDNGDIIKDSVIKIDNLKFEGIDLGYAFTKLSVYKHNFNGTSNWVENKFYGELGCNGTVSLKFNTPIYLWLLEHL